mmetsp:Transcript_33605/g.75991  ORF Transcript_33605/g.75991 Transcript_33605/m.75991 type:complete len:324 (+) Transcript_33605:202-1173(+)
MVLNPGLARPEAPANRTHGPIRVPAAPLCEAYAKRRLRNALVVIAKEHRPRFWRHRWVESVHERVDGEGYDAESLFVAFIGQGLVDNSGQCVERRVPNQHHLPNDPSAHLIEVVVDSAGKHREGTSGITHEHKSHALVEVAKAGERKVVQVCRAARALHHSRALEPQTCLKPWLGLLLGHLLGLGRSRAARIWHRLVPKFPKGQRQRRLGNKARRLGVERRRLGPKNPLPPLKQPVVDDVCRDQDLCSRDGGVRLFELVQGRAREKQGPGHFKLEGGLVRVGIVLQEGRSVREPELARQHFGLGIVAELAVHDAHRTAPVPEA